jgi:type II secretory pathway component HofQ
MRALSTVVESVGLVVVPDPDGLVYRIADPLSLTKELVTEVMPLKYLTLPSDYVATIKNELVDGKNEAPSIQDRVKNFTLVKALSAVISKDVGRIDYDLTSNSLLITDTLTKIAEVKRIIQLIDIEPVMVQVDVKFVSTRRSDVMNVGVNSGAADGKTRSAFRWTPPAPTGNAGRPRTMPRRPLPGNPPTSSGGSPSIPSRRSSST